MTEYKIDSIRIGIGIQAAVERLSGFSVTNPKIIYWTQIGGLRACVESSEALREWRVYLINTIKKPFEGLIADTLSC